MFSQEPKLVVERGACQKMLVAILATGTVMDQEYKGTFRFSTWFGCSLFHDSNGHATHLAVCRPAERYGVNCELMIESRKALTTSRYTAPLLFPILDSFPSIFDVGSGHTEKLAVHAGLTTSTAVAEQVRAIEQIVKRLVAVDEREALCNGLQVIAEEYDEGWDGDLTDSDDDE